MHWSHPTFFCGKCGPLGTQKEQQIWIGDFFGWETDVYFCHPFAPFYSMGALNHSAMCQDFVQHYQPMICRDKMNQHVCCQASLVFHNYNSNHLWMCNIFEVGLSPAFRLMLKSWLRTSPSEHCWATKGSKPNMIQLMIAMIMFAITIAIWNDIMAGDQGGPNLRWARWWLQWLQDDYGDHHCDLDDDLWWRS